MAENETPPSETPDGAPENGTSKTIPQTDATVASQEPVAGAAQPTQIPPETQNKATPRADGQGTSQISHMYSGLFLIIFSGLCGFAVYKYDLASQGAKNLDRYIIIGGGMLLALISVFMGSRIMMTGISAPAVIIPAEDRKLLEDLIMKSADGISDYVRLSSLTGVTGAATQLGLTGLPMATVGLTLFFALGSIFHAEGFVDLTKLTLGAFIGSFVQRNVSGGPSGAAGKTGDGTQ